jgi:hypothetical protein
VVYTGIYSYSGAESSTDFFKKRIIRQMSA